jgi:uncharacterized protein (TIRG00374 family)
LSVTAGRPTVINLLTRVSASLVVSGFFIWLSLRRTDLHAVAVAMGAAPRQAFLAYFGILLVVHLVRTGRWGILLAPAGRVSFRRLNSASAVGFMLLMVLPLRLGELTRPLLIASPDADGESSVTLSGAMAACVVERVLDGLSIGLIGVIALRFLDAQGEMADFVRHASVVVTTMFVVVCFGLATVVSTRKQTIELLRRLLAVRAPRLVARCEAALDEFSAAVSLGSWLRLVAVLALTALHWSLHVIGFALLAQAFGLRLTPLMACAVLAAQAVGMMVPAGPGMVGTSQFFTQAGVSIFVAGALTVPAVATRAAAYANAIWMLQFGQQVSLGLLFWPTLGFPLRALKPLKFREPAPRTNREVGSPAAS